MRLFRTLLVAMTLLHAATTSAATDDPSGTSSAVTPTAAAPAVAPAPRNEPPTVDKVGVEREALARIAHELVALRAQVRDASRSAPTMARVQFRYDWLESDLELIERAIRDHMDAPRQPRAIPPLKGDYRH